MKVNFTVDGEWLTNFFRTRFWGDKCGFDKAIDIIKTSLCADIPEDFCIALLEGRKKLVGTNEFKYVDDNENIRPMSLYIKEQEQANIQHQIINDIETYPYNYIDQYACSTSRFWMKPFEEQLKGISWWYDELVYERGNKYDELQNGCSWFDRLETTAKMIMNHTDKKKLNYKEFADILFAEYELTIEMLRENKTPFSELNDHFQAIICRNRHYSMTNALTWSYLDESMFITKKQIERMAQEKKDKLEKDNHDDLLKKQ